MSLSHQQISWIKSGIRILGYVLLIPTSAAAALVLVVSELIGIYEEIGH